MIYLALLFRYTGVVVIEDSLQKVYYNVSLEFDTKFNFLRSVNMMNDTPAVMQNNQERGAPREREGKEKERGERHREEGIGRERGEWEREIDSEISVFYF